ncbi:hypothetical protein M0R45_026442 [Rubus argutus]|uniref:Uncharacterized protein n=1 Tax=Rubus argutus TaxID=59490 RepID=A0AAW1X154_RUBAR
MVDDAQAASAWQIWAGQRSTLTPAELEARAERQWVVGVGLGGLSTGDAARLKEAAGQLWRQGLGGCAGDCWVS